MPRDLLEPAYLADKSTFVSLPYWTTDYVGAGPFKLREFVRDSHMVLEALTVMRWVAQDRSDPDQVYPGPERVDRERRGRRG